MANWQLNYYALAMFITAAISFGLAVYIWRRQGASGRVPLAILMAATAEWAFGYAMELGSPELPGKLFWTNFNFLGIVCVPAAWLVFTLEYTHHDKWLTRRNLILLAVIPVTTLLLDWTNDAHKLIRSAAGLDLSGAIPMLNPTYAIGFWVYWAFSLAMLLIGTILVIHALITSPGLYRGQAAALLMAVLVPWIGNTIYLSGLSPFPKLDLTPPAFTIAGLFIAWGLFRYRLLDIVPVARDAVIESMSDGVIVVDAQARVVDINPAAQQLVHLIAPKAIGLPVSQALPGEAGQPGRYTATVETQSEIALEANGTSRYFSMSLSPLYDRRNRLTGRLVMLHDITERKQAEAALQDYQRQLEASYQREQEKRRLSDTLREVAKIVSGTLAQQKVLDLVLAQLEKVITYHHATVMLLAGDELTVVAERDKQGNVIASNHFPVSKYPLNAAVLRDGQPLLLSDVAHDGRWLTSATMGGIRSFINAPLLVKTRPIGVLSVGRHDETPYTEDDAQTVFAFANQVAVALEQARLHEYEIKQIERDLEIARQIQTSLLPIAAPEMPGLDIAGLSRPARQVGGDFYNYFVFDRTQLGIAVGDVSGKGMQAALMMALSVGLLTTQAHRDLSPAALLSMLNVELRPHTERSKLNTALVYLVLQPINTGWELLVGNAGLIAPLVRRSNGQVEWWDIGGLPLGTKREEGKKYEELTQVLHPGDVLVLSSDGIVEAMNQDRELYGFERLTACVAVASGQTAQDIQDYILADVSAFVDGAEQHDDMTLVVAKINE